MTNSTEVGAIIARAAELKQASEDQLTPEQVREVAAELGIEGAFVDAAVNDLRRRQEQKHKDDEARLVAAKARRKKMLTGVVVFDLVLVAVGGVAYGAANDAVATLSAAEATVNGAVVRQKETEALFLAKKGEREADAELAGAQNRIAIAKKAYDAAAVAYNARSPLARLGGSLSAAPSARRSRRSAHGERCDHLACPRRRRHDRPPRHRRR